MSYLEFLGRPYNLVFLAAGFVGAGVLIVGRRREEDLFLAHTGLIALAVAGLTLNGAIHDLALGDPADRFPAVLGLSVVLAAASAGVGRLIRDRFFPPVREVHFNERGLEGVEARIVSRSVDADPASGRAHWHDGEGGLHLVSCHTAEGRIEFGTTVRLEEFDDEHGSYVVRPT